MEHKAIPIGKAYAKGKYGYALPFLFYGTPAIGQQFWEYTTPDQITSVSAPGYFSSISINFKVNDIIIITRIAQQDFYALIIVAIDNYAVITREETSIPSSVVETVSISDFWNGIDTDHTIAVQNALNYAALNSIPLVVGSKFWIVTSPLTVTLTGDNSLSVYGGGCGISGICFNTGDNGILINVPGNYWLFNAGGSNGIVFNNLSLTTTNSYTGVGIHIVGNSFQGRPAPRIIFDNVDFRGYSLPSQYWDTSLVLENAGETWLESCRFVIGGPSNTTSTGVRAFGSAQANSPVVLNVDHCELYYGNTAISIGDYFEGVYVTQATIVGSLYGIQYDTSSTESGLHVIGGHINTKQKGIYVNNLFDFVISNVLFYRGDTTTPNYYGIETNGAVGRFSISGSVFKGSGLADGETAVLFLATSANIGFRGGMISSNDFHSFGTRAIWLGANAHRVHVGSNTYQDCALRVLNQSTDCIADPNIYSTSLSLTLTGGTATETVSIAIPTGYFLTKPGNVNVMSQSLAGVPIIGQYDFSNAGSTAINAIIVLRMLDGTNIPAGAIKIGVLAIENTGSGSW